MTNEAGDCLVKTGFTSDENKKKVIGVKSECSEHTRKYLSVSDLAWKTKHQINVNLGCCVTAQRSCRK